MYFTNVSSSTPLPFPKKSGDYPWENVKVQRNSLSLVFLVYISYIDDSFWPSSYSPKVTKDEKLVLFFACCFFWIVYNRHSDALIWYIIITFLNRKKSFPFQFCSKKDAFIFNTLNQNEYFGKKNRTISITFEILRKKTTCRSFGGKREKWYKHLQSAIR